MFEQSERIGGLWPISKQDDGLVNPDMCVNQSRHTVSFSDLAWPASAPVRRCLLDPGLESQVTFSLFNISVNLKLRYSQRHGKLGNIYSVILVHIRDTKSARAPKLSRQAKGLVPPGKSKYNRKLQLKFLSMTTLWLLPDFLPSPRRYHLLWHNPFRLLIAQNIVISVAFWAATLLLRPIMALIQLLL